MEKAQIEFLQRMPIFGGVRDDILEFLLGLSRTVTRAKDEHYYREGEKGTNMYVLMRGKVAILKAWQGKDYFLRYLGPGDCFGEMALIDLCPRSASVVAAEDCRAIEIPSSGLLKLYQKDVEQFAMIHMNMGREVSRRLREADNRLFRAKIEAELVDGDYVFHAM